MSLFGKPAIKTKEGAKHKKFTKLYLVLPVSFIYFGLSMNKLIAYLITFVITGIILYIIGFLIAVIIVSVILLINRIIAYHKRHKRFSDWEFSQYLHSNHVTINGKIVTQKVREYKRLDRRENIWETKVVAEPINQIYYTGKRDKSTKLEDIFNLYYKP